VRAVSGEIALFRVGHHMYNAARLQRAGQKHLN
jgi:hypothetical protein